MAKFTYEEIETFRDWLYSLREDLRETPLLFVSYDKPINKGSHITIAVSDEINLSLVGPFALMTDDLFAIDIKAQEFVAVQRDNNPQLVLKSGEQNEN